MTFIMTVAMVSVVVFVVTFITTLVVAFAVAFSVAASYSSSLDPLFPPSLPFPQRLAPVILISLTVGFVQAFPGPSGVGGFVGSRVCGRMVVGGGR